MSIYKKVSGKNTAKTDLSRMLEYIIDPLKTNGGKYVGSRGCLANHVVDNWSSVKKLNHKTGGKQGEHFVLSVTAGGKIVNPKDLMKIGSEFIETILDGFQCVYSVHIDSKIPHIHVICNPVSYKDGHRFHISNSDLPNIRLNINKLLNNNGYDIIRCKAEGLVDETPYDLSQGFDFLEVEDEPYVDPFADILAEPEDRYFEDDEAVQLCDNSDTATYSQPSSSYFSSKINTTQCDYNESYCDYNKEVYTMSYNYNSSTTAFNSPAGSLPVADTTNANVSSVPTVPNTAELEHQKVMTPSLPTLELDFSHKIAFNIDEGVEPEKVKAYLQDMIPKVNYDKFARGGIAMMQSIQDHGINANLRINAGPCFELNFLKAPQDVAAIGTGNTPCYNCPCSKTCSYHDPHNPNSLCNLM